MMLNQYYTSMLSILLVIAACNGNYKTVYKNNNTWFGTDGAGVCQYDGRAFIKFTGLSF